MRPEESAVVVARRRRWILALLDDGRPLNEVVRRMDCQVSSVMRWRDTRDWVGENVFEVKASPGRPARLPPAQRRGLLRLLSKGPVAHGYATDLWTCDRIARLIRREFRVGYHRDHIGRLMHQLGWSDQNPERRAPESNQGTPRRLEAKEVASCKKDTARPDATSSSQTIRA